MSRFAFAAAALLCAACGAGPPSISPSPASPPPAVAATASAVVPAPPAPSQPADRPPPDSNGECRPLVALVPSDDADVTRDLADGLRTAFDEARRAGGPDLELRVAGTSARWGSQVEEAVQIAFDAGALALVTPPERRHAHLLSQLGTKVRLPTLSTARDPRVAAAGSTWVVPVTEPLELAAAKAIDGLPPPAFDPPEARPWERVGRELGRRVAEAVRAHGLRREGFVEAVRATGASR